MNVSQGTARGKPEQHEPLSLSRFVGYFLWLGTVGFGGPIALAGHMQQDLVDTRGWISKEDYVEGLALAQLAPGPLAAQLAIYLGYLRAGVLGATLVGWAFILPSFVMVLALSAAYVRFGGLAWMQGMFYGIGAAVIGIIARSAFKLTKITLGKDRMLWAIFGVLAVSPAWTSREIIWLFLLGGVVTMLVVPSAGARGERGGLVPGNRSIACEQPVVGNLSVFRQSRNVCLRQWPGYCPVLVRRSSARTPLAHGSPVCGRSGGSDDHAGTSGNHGGFHRLPGCGREGRYGGCTGRVLARVSGRSGAGTIV